MTNPRQLYSNLDSFTITGGIYTCRRKVPTSFEERYWIDLDGFLTRMRLGASIRKPMVRGCCENFLLFLEVGCELVLSGASPVITDSTTGKTQQ